MFFSSMYLVVHGVLHLLQDVTYTPSEDTLIILHVGSFYPCSGPLRSTSVKMHPIIRVRIPRNIILGSVPLRSTSVTRCYLQHRLV